MAGVSGTTLLNSNEEIDRTTWLMLDALSELFGWEARELETLVVAELGEPLRDFRMF